MKIRAAWSPAIAVLILSLSAAACTGEAGAPGAAGAAGAPGGAGENGTNGTNGGAGDSGTPATEGASAPVSEVVLPSNSFFPESVTSDASGKLYVSSASLGSIVTVSPDGRTVTQLIAPEIVSASPAVSIAKLGLLVDDAKKDLWVCTLNTQTYGSTLRRYDATSGAQKASLNLANVFGVCNDLAMDKAGNLYLSDSFVGIERLPAGGTALEVWKNDPLLAAGMGQFAADGIVVDGTDVYVNNLTNGTLLRVPIGAGGAAGNVTPITVKTAAGATVSLSSPDGMRLRAPHTLLVAESGADLVSEVTIDPATNTAVRAIFASRVDRPSSVAIVNGAVWIAEGQIARLFGLEDTAVNYPFYVKRMPLH